MNGATWLLVVFVGIVVAFVAYGLARRARGSIEVTLPKSDYEPGETVHGQVMVHAKKPIEAERLVVTLTATEITETVKDGETSSTSEEVFRGERVLEEARAYAAGTRETREFAIDLPDRKPTPVPEPIDDKASFASLKSKRAPKTRLQWRLKVHLTAKGIDLGTSRSLTVNIERL